MNIGVDIDEVVAEYLDAMHSFISKRYNLNFTKEQYHTYWFNDVWQLPKDQFLEIFHAWRDSSNYDQILPVQGSDVLNELAKHHQIFFITSRDQVLSQRTMEWLQKNFMFPIRVYHSRNNSVNAAGKSKIEICHELHIDVIIEDQDKFSLECAKDGIPVILFNKPWNKTLGQHPLITRIDSWNQVPPILAQIEKMRDS